MNESDNLRRSLDGLVALGQTPDVDIRPVLLRVLVDLFARKTHHSASEVRQFVEITQKLFDVADDETRFIVTEKLSACQFTPPALFDHFLQEGGRLAEAVLARAPVQSGVLLAAASSGSREQALAIARRSDLDLTVAKSLAERSENDVVIALARNPLAPLNRRLVQDLVKRARDDAELSQALLNRPCEAADLAPLFLLASAEQRAAIILAACRADLGPESRRPRLNGEEAVALSRIERSIAAPDQDSFDVALAAAFRIPLADAWRIIDDPRGEPLAIALAAAGASPEFAARVFILSGPAIGHSVMAVRSLVGVVENVSMRTARRLLAAMVGTASPAPKGKPAPESEAGPVRRRHSTDSKPSRATAVPVSHRLSKDRGLR